ncbi:MAG: DUF2867 domain-containing protein, partial [Planctomycetota bacterium]
EVVFTDIRSRHTSVSPEQLWKAVERSVPTHWKIEERDSGRLLKLRADRRAPGDRWLEMRITPEGAGSRYEQQAIFYPRGLLGRMYWYALRPLQAVALDRRVKKLTSGVS